MIGSVRASLLVAAAVLAATAAPSVAEAHARSTSYGQLVLRQDGATVRLRLRALDLDALRAAGLTEPEQLEAHLESAVGVSAGDAACTPVEGSFASLSSPAATRRWEWRVRCDGRPTSVHATPVPQVAGHLCFVRSRWEGSSDGDELVLSERAPTAALAGPGAEGAGSPAFVRFLPIGIEHILSGFDHLAFLGVLLLLAVSLRETTGIVTGFTLGHSVTLAVAALGVVKPDTGTVEALIGLSVAVVAAENVWLREGRRTAAIPVVAVAVPGALAVVTGHPAFAGVALFVGCHFALSSRSDDPVAWRWALAGLFGLLHGFGFAGALGRGGLEGTDAVGALLGFNVGVELGQLAVVALAWPALTWVRGRGERAHTAVIYGGSALGAVAGVFWLVSRALG